MRMTGATPVSAPASPGEINLLGVKVSALNLESATARLSAAIRAGRRGYVCLCGAHGLVDSQSMPELRRAYNEAFLVTPDGMPLVWELRRQGHTEAGRVYGPDLMLELMREPGLRHALYGTTEHTLTKLEHRLKELAPAATIVCRIAPPFRALTPEEEDKITRDLNAADADLIWVGLGAPKQELWMARMRERLTAPMLIGVGAAFDFHAGNTPQAPGWVQQRGLEWLYRLTREPKRLWRRYVRVVPGYLYLLALQRTGLRGFAAPPQIEVQEAP